MLDYLTSSEFWSAFGTSLGGVALAVVLLGWTAKRWIGARIDRDVEDTYKAKQQERQSDYDRALEQHRLALSKELEGWKAGYRKAIDENQIRFSRLHAEQADAIKSLYGLLVRMERKLRVLTNPLQFVPQDEEAKKEFFAAQRQEYVEAFVSFRDSYQENRIFLLPDVCQQIDALLEKAHAVYVDFTTYDGAPEELDNENRKQRRELQHAADQAMRKEFPSLREGLENAFRQAMGLHVVELDHKA